MKTHLSVMLLAVAKQYDGVFVCGCSESWRVEAAVHQTLTAVQVGYTPMRVSCPF